MSNLIKTGNPLPTAAIWLAVAGLMLGLAGGLRAEPYMSVREGYKCSKCHVNRTGGGKRTDYGQIYMNTRLATNNPAGESGAGDQAAAGKDFSNGNLSEFFSVGADLRTSHTWVSPQTGDTRQEFNRPSQCASCHQATGGGGKLAEIYFQMKAAPDHASLVVSQNLLPTTDSREVYALIEQLPLAGYVKAGRFRLPTGLQNTFDDPFAHGAGRLNHGFNGVTGVETVRGTGVEMGVEPGPFAVTLSMTNPESLSQVPRAKRVALSTYAVGGLGLAGLNYANDPLSATETRNTTGGFGGVHLGRFTTLMQVDLITTTDSELDTELTQRAGLAELDFLPAKGVNLKLLYEYIDPDLDGGADIVDRLSLIYEHFLTPSLRVKGGYRDYTGPEGDEASNFSTYFAELHFIY